MEDAKVRHVGTDIEGLARYLVDGYQQSPPGRDLTGPLRDRVVRSGIDGCID